jgi:hypothetical protein
MKAIVEFICDDQQHRTFKKGDRGVIDGYVRGANSVPYVMVIKKGRIGGELVYASVNQLLILNIDEMLTTTKPSYD